MAFSAGTEVLGTDSESLFKGKHNTLAEVVGDKTLLTTLVKTSLVEGLNSLVSQVNDIVIGQLALPNDVYLTGGASGGGQINILKVNTANKIAFGTPVIAIDIQGGTISALSSPVPISAGGTGAITVPAAQIALGLAINSNVQAWDTNLDQLAALTPLSDNFITGNGSAWIQRTPAQARVAMAVKIGGTDADPTVQAYSARLDQIAGFNPPAANNFIVSSGAGTWSLKDAAAAGVSLGLILDTTVQRWDANLDQIAALSPTNDNFIVGNGSAWALETPAQARTSLQLGTLAQASTVDNSVWSGSPLSLANGGTGASTQGGAQTALGIGTMGTQSAASVAITGGTITGATLTINNNVALQWKDSGGTARSIVTLNSSNNLLLNAHGTQLHLQVGGTVRFLVDASSFIPNTNDAYAIGGASNRVDAGYFRTVRLCNDISNSSSDMIIGPTSGNSIYLRTNNSNRWAVDGSGNLLPVTSDAFNIGAAGNRVANAYLRTILKCDSIAVDGGGMIVGPTSSHDLTLRWGAASRWIGSSNDFYPVAAGGANLGNSSNYINGVTALVLSAPGNNHLLLQAEGSGEVRIRNNGNHWWTFGNFGIFTPTTAGTLDIGIDNSNQVNAIYADAYLTFTGCHRFDDIEGKIEVGDAVYVDHDKKGNRLLKKCSKAKDARVAGIYKGIEHVKDMETGEPVRSIHIMAAVGDNESGSLKGFRVSKAAGIPKNGSLLMVGEKGDLVLQEGTQIHSYTVGKCLEDLTEKDFDAEGIAKEVYGVIYAG